MNDGSWISFDAEHWRVSTFVLVMSVFPFVFHGLFQRRPRLRHLAMGFFICMAILEFKTPALFVVSVWVVVLLSAQMKRGEFFS